MTEQPRATGASSAHRRPAQGATAVSARGSRDALVISSQRVNTGVPSRSVQTFIRIPLGALCVVLLVASCASQRLHLPDYGIRIPVANLPGLDDPAPSGPAAASPARRTATEP